MDLEKRQRQLLCHYQHIRKTSQQLAEPLTEEDCLVQSMTDASPTKWHLAHTTWFFETLVLHKQKPRYQWFNASYQHLFNSYYNALGSQFSRPQRGVLSRPNLTEICTYRCHVDTEIEDLLHTQPLDESALFTLELGIHHEQQHQELLLMDIKHAFSCNPLLPAYSNSELGNDNRAVATLQWQSFDEGVVQIGNGGESFCYDNERPAHKTYRHGFRLAHRTVSNAEYQQFINDGGYQNPLLWHSDGWAFIQEHGIRHPLYWHQRDDQWFEFTLHGLTPLNPNLPVCHISFYEAYAYAHWAGKRLPSEQEWEAAVAADQSSPNYLKLERLHPQACLGTDMQAMLGNCWEWTSSSYAPYPGFKPFAGEAGEYNGKFMVGQYVLRGGCAFTPVGHSRPTYRNFFYPHHRWQLCGIRLAEDLT